MFDLSPGSLCADLCHRGHSANRWITCLRRNPNACVRLFCFPPAGGGAWTFHSWRDLVSPDIEICAIQLPGRVTNFGERPFTRLSPLVQMVGLILQPYLDRPFAIFGHSMGGLVGFELARHLRRLGEPSPSRLFISAHRAPQLPDREDPIHELSEPQFWARLRIVYGMPCNLAADAELMDLYSPVLRADLAVCETYVYTNEDAFDFPITVFGGTEDYRVSSEELTAWRVQTHRNFKLRMFSGGHFYLENTSASILESLAEDLNAVVG